MLLVFTKDGSRQGCRLHNAQIERYCTTLAGHYIPQPYNVYQWQQQPGFVKPVNFVMPPLLRLYLNVFFFFAKRLLLLEPVSNRVQLLSLFLVWTLVWTRYGGFKISFLFFSSSSQPVSSPVSSIIIQYSLMKN